MQRRAPASAAAPLIYNFFNIFNSLNIFHEGSRVTSSRQMEAAKALTGAPTALPHFEKD